VQLCGSKGVLKIEPYTKGGDVEIADKDEASSCIYDVFKN
jgi:hypothetical protein